MTNKLTATASARLKFTKKTNKEDKPNKQLLAGATVRRVGFGT
jgi:hypothetical protein